MINLKRLPARLISIRASRCLLYRQYILCMHTHNHMLLVKLTRIPGISKDLVVQRTTQL